MKTIKASNQIVFIFFLINWFVTNIFCQKNDTIYQTNLYPGSKGWISKYLNLVTDSKIKIDLQLNNQTLTPFSRPDSLIYANQISDSNWTIFEKQKLWFFESLLNLYLNKNETLNHTNFINTLVDFYEISSDSTKQFVGIEKVINSRILNKKQYGKFLWFRYEMNPFIYIDLILYEEFLNSGLTISEFPFLELKMAFLKMTNERFMLDGILSENEKRFFELLNCNTKNRKINNIKFSLDYADELLKSIKANQILFGYNFEIFSLDGISTVENCWLNKKYGKIDLNAKSYEYQVFKKSNLMAFTYLFVSNWKIIKNRTIKKILLEIHETKKWGQLWFKKESLTKDERKFRKSQSKDVIMLLPSAIIFIIPGGSVILPFVVNFVPVFVPSAFRDNSIQ